MMAFRVALVVLGLSGALGMTLLAAPMIEMRGLKAGQGCLQPSSAATETLRTCPIDGDRIRIWCPNRRVFDRDAADSSVAVLRSICELNQLPG